MTNERKEKNSGEVDLSAFYIPAWLSEELSAGTCRSLGTQATQACLVEQRTLLLPHLHHGQLLGLSVLVDRLQQQLLGASSPSPDELTLKITHEFLKSAGRGSFSKDNDIQVLFSQLGGLKILIADQHGALQAQPFFAKEWWNFAHDQRDLYLQLAPYSGELLLGLVDGVRECKRSLADEIRLKTVLANTAPLLVERALWQSLLPIEQLLLVHHLRFRDASLRETTGGSLRAQALEAAFAEAVFAKKLTFIQKTLILQRFAKKLSRFGLLQQLGEAACLSLELSSPAPQIIWQFSADRVINGKSAEFLAAVNAFFARQNWASASPAHPCLEMLSGGLSEEISKPFRQTLLTVVLEEQEAGATSSDFVILNHNLLIAAAALFCEWSLRIVPGHSCGLRQELLGIQVFASLALVGESREEVRHKYALFLKWFREEQKLAEFLGQTPLASVFAPLSQESKEFGQYRQVLRQKYSNSLSLYPGLVPNKLVEISESSLLEQGTKITLKEEARRGFPASLAARATNIFAGGQRGKSQIIDKIKGASSQQYHTLLSNYFNSLDQPAQQIVLNLKERLPPHLFEVHLIKRLARFLADNPDHLP